MNEDERGITPPEEGTITVERDRKNWQVTLERGNGDFIQVLDLTEMERAQLACLLEMAPNAVGTVSCSFVDVTRVNGNGKAH